MALLVGMGAAGYAQTGGMSPPARWSPPDFEGDLERWLPRALPQFSAVWSDPAKYRLQIIYTQIDRDEQGAPQFHSYRYRVDEREYFYPASTVKLPAAVLALEKLRRLQPEGIDAHTPMIVGEAAAGLMDPSDAVAIAATSVADHVRDILLVSDNAAFNALYDFIGPDALNGTLAERGLTGARFVHRLESAGDTDHATTGPVRFVDEAGRLLHQQPVMKAHALARADEQISLGVAEIIRGQRVDAPKDFAGKNAWPLQAQHDFLVSLLFPEHVEPARRPQLAAQDYALLRKWMSTTPVSSGYPRYADRGTYPDGFVKFLLFGGNAAHIPPYLHIYNKIGQAYGFLTDMAYIVDEQAGVEFLLGATIYVNANGTFNDDHYEYAELGLPFLAALGWSIHALEVERANRDLR